MKFWKIFLVLFVLVYVFGVVLRLIGILWDEKGSLKPFAGTNWAQVFLLGELDGRSELITPRWWIRMIAIITLPLVFAGLITHKKIRFT
jgi:hypothetical protein